MSGTNRITGGEFRKALPINGKYKPDPDRLPPHNLQAERSLLGGIFQSPGIIHNISTLIVPDDFYRASHSTVFRAMLVHEKEGLPIDLTSIGERLQKENTYEFVGGDELIRDIIDSCPHAAHAMHHAAIIREKSALRQMITVAEKMIRDCYDDNLAADKVEEAAEKAIFTIRSRTVRGEPIPVGEVVPPVMDDLRSRIDGPRPGVRTGLDIDKTLNGFRGGELVVMAARPGMGKTALALAFADKISRAECKANPRTERPPPILFFSLEMKAPELTERLLAMTAGVCGSDLRGGGELTRTGLEEIERKGADRHVGALPILIDDTSGRTVSQVASITRRAFAMTGVRAIIIDYLQLFSVDVESRRNLNREQQIAEMTRLLKGVARDCDVPVILLAQLNRECESRTDKRPVLSDLRESGAIEQDADSVLMLYREEYYDPGTSKRNEVEVLIRKNRHGPTGAVSLYFDKKSGRFDNITHHHDGQEQPGHGYY